MEFFFKDVVRYFDDDCVAAFASFRRGERAERRGEQRGERALLAAHAAQQADDERLSKADAPKQPEQLSEVGSARLEPGDDASAPSYGLCRILFSCCAPMGARLGAGGIEMEGQQSPMLTKAAVHAAVESCGSCM